jgi:hypothetical protein
VPDPMIAPSVCAEGWICFFCILSARLLRVLNAFLLPECGAVSVDAIALRRVLANHEMSARRKT